MNDNQENKWTFVLKHYKPGKFNARLAARRFRKSHGIVSHVITAKWRYAASAAALIAILLTAGIYLHKGTTAEAEWCKVTATD